MVIVLRIPVLIIQNYTFHVNFPYARDKVYAVCKNIKGINILFSVNIIHLTNYIQNIICSVFYMILVVVSILTLSHLMARERTGYIIMRNS